MAKIRIPHLGITINGIRVLEKDTGGLYVQMPDLKNNKNQWLPTITFDDTHLIKEIEDAILSYTRW